jgi:hypothetical protein
MGYAKKIVTVELESVKMVNKYLTDTKKEFDKLEVLRRKYTDSQKSVREVVSEFNSQLNLVKGSASAVSSSANELTKKSKDLGLDVPPISSNAIKVADGYLSRANALAKDVK